jgi:hypothetical protein
MTSYFDNQTGFDKQFGKDIGKTIIITVLTASITHLVAWGFEKLKASRLALATNSSLRGDKNKKDRDASNR